jgi:acyl-CoA synthetase (AMP-forming)/AMP-acid ligase II/acyl carrier protein
MSPERNFVDVLRSWTARRPEQTALTFLEDGEVPTALTYAALDRRARDVAAGILRSAKAGDRVLLLHPPGLEFAAAFFGCLYAGVVPVPAYPPRNPRHFPRIEAIIEDADVRCVLTQTDFKDRLAAWLERRAGKLTVICTDALAGDEAGEWEPSLAFTDNALAFLQYTSGSTGDPKGVMVTHGNLMSNQRMIQKAFGNSEGLVGVSWLPIYHDMGLIGNLMQPLFLGGHAVLMSPAAFIQKPLRWLAAISRFRADGSGGPNFAFRLCTKSVTDEQKAGLDLSSLRVMFSGSEPINARDLEEFATAFRETGFRREALYCCYGMAETTLLATGSTPGAGPVLEIVDTDALSRNVAQPPRSDAGPRRLVVGCGHAVDGQELVVVDPEGAGRLEDGRVGEIWVRGPNVARGYWRKSELTQEMFDARLSGSGSDDRPFFRTGDLGFLREGELFVTGRLKDLIIIRGRNHYPHDIELTVQKSHPAFRTGAGAAFSMDVDGEERLVVVQEIDRHRHHEAEDAVTEIRSAIVDEHEVAPYSVVLVRQNAVPKTSSGKIQRGASARELRDGTLPIVYQWTESPASATTASEAGGETANTRTREEIEDFLLQKLSSGLAVSSDDVDVNQPFSSFGLDSLRTLALLDEVESWLGRSLSPTLFWDYPTIAELAAHLASEMPEQPVAEGRRS